MDLAPFESMSARRIEIYPVADPEPEFGRGNLTQRDPLVFVNLFFDRFTHHPSPSQLPSLSGERSEPRKIYIFDLKMNPTKKSRKNLRYWPKNYPKIPAGTGILKRTYRKLAIEALVC